ncbi:MAG: ECF transporter S component [bacterium]|jgi:hypothetical protein
MSAKPLISGGLLVALGVLLPMTVHITGVGGTILLPMHIPIFFAGVILGPSLAVLVGVLTPIISTLLTGMPPVAPMPMLQLMIVELAVYGWAMGYLCRILRLNIWLALLGAMIAGRIALGLAVVVIAPLFIAAPINPIVYLQGAIVTGLPGIILQLLIVPPVAQRFFLSRGQEEPLSDI